MRIQTESLPDTGLAITVDKSDPWANGAARIAFDAAAETLNGELHVRRFGPGVRVVGSLTASAIKACDACLDSVQLEINGDLDLFYEKPPKGQTGEVELDMDALDTGFYDGVELNLTDVLCEFLALQCPPRVRCGEEGIERLSGGECRPLVDQLPADDAIDPRLAPLKNLKLND